MVSLARALLALARSRQTGVPVVQSEHGVCRFAVVDGTLRAAAGQHAAETTLGDVLLSDGALEPAAHAEALARRGSAAEPVGRWLLESGLVSRAALELALRRQLRDRAL